MKVVQCGRNDSVTAAISRKQDVNFVLLLRLVDSDMRAAVVILLTSKSRRIQMTVCMSFKSPTPNWVYTTIFSGLSFHVHVRLL